MNAQPETDAVLLRADRGGVAWLTLNRPGARNALSLGLMAALEAELVAIAEDPAVQVVVLGAAGPGFCAGHDLREMRARPERAAYQEVFEACSRLMLRLVRLPKPVIARVHGIATPPAANSSPPAILPSPPTRRASPPLVSISACSARPRWSPCRARSGARQRWRCSSTGDLIDAARAREIGLINRVVPEAALDDAVAALAAQIAAKSPLTLAIGKEAFYCQAELGLEEAYRFAAETMTRNMLARDAEEGIEAFLGKRAPVWTGT